MPSLEIICINQQEPSDFSQLPFIVEVEKELGSHRIPAPRFQLDFDKLSGCIYHLLDGNSPTCYDLLVWDWRDSEGNCNGRDESVVFKDEYAAALKGVLEKLLSSSPVGQILFTTDYQFGPEVTQRFEPMPFVEFQELYNAGKVRMNASYLVTAS
ncbi:MAG: hypothetical protein KME05_08890 [Gloeocapsa sp. UFS-A4-WI-NPMV-4B04]|jgi:hypothetical protein|nr:hypothetical protein [Gloeocapsa sp. UFS-A4-WI-NPMV-4B04]